MASSSGFARDLFLLSKQVFNGADPELKITPPGYLEMLMNTNAPEVSSMAIQPNGTCRDIKFKYRQRSIPGESQTEYSCDTDNFPLWNEATITHAMFRQVSINFDFDTICKLEAEEVAFRAVGGNAPAGFKGVMNVVWNAIARSLNGLLGDIDIDLATKQNLNWGYNAVDHLNSAHTVNFPLNGANNDLTSGMTGLIANAMFNEVNINDYAAVGNGLLINYWIQNILKAAKSADQAGLNTQLLGMPDFYPDYNTITPWGADVFGLIDKGAINFLDLNVNQGFRAVDLGTSVFFSLPIPITDSSGKTFTMNFDIQIKSNDCAVEVQDRYSQTLSIGPGYTVFIRKNYDVFFMPGNVYSAGDRLAGANGTLKYHATNT